MGRGQRSSSSFKIVGRHHNAPRVYVIKGNVRVVVVPASVLF